MEILYNENIISQLDIIRCQIKLPVLGMGYIFSNH